MSYCLLFYFCWWDHAGQVYDIITYAKYSHTMQGDNVALPQVLLVLEAHSHPQLPFVISFLIWQTSTSSGSRVFPDRIFHAIKANWDDIFYNRKVQGLLYGVIITLHKKDSLVATTKNVNGREISSCNEVFLCRSVSLALRVCQEIQQCS